MRVVTLIGADGSMGRRYQAILKYLGLRAILFDTAYGPIIGSTLDSAVASSDGVIIATPTHTHGDYIMRLDVHGVPILCEKPANSDPKKIQSPFSMMMNYSLLDEPLASGETFYDYFRPGSESAYENWFQLLALARGDLKLNTDSPIWRCRLNGKRLILETVERSIVDYVYEWLRDPNLKRDLIAEWHQRAWDAYRKLNLLHAH